MIIEMEINNCTSVQLVTVQPAVVLSQSDYHSVAWSHGAGLKASGDSISASSAVGSCVSMCDL